MEDVVQQGGTIPVWAAIGSLIAILATIVGLVVWLVKKNMNRQEKITDRYLQSMENQVISQSKTHEMHAASTLRLAETVNENTNQLKELTRIVGQCNPDRRHSP
jgi:uncharacterized membrane-anchored protein YhcB (DUF1043 family)